MPKSDSSSFNLPPPPPYSSSTLPPLSAVPPTQLYKVKRSDSLRSSQSDLSSDNNRRVSFNSDIRVKRIPKSKLVLARASLFEREQGPFAQVTKESPPYDQEQIANEAQLILNQLRGVQCSVSSTRDSGTVRTPVTYNLGGKFVSSGSDASDSGLQVSSSGGDPSSMHIAEVSLTSADTTASEGATRFNNKLVNRNDSNNLFGLHALNNLDIAVNGKNVNSMPSYHVLRKGADSSGGSAEYSPPLKRNNITKPTKPPRKGTSVSPPPSRNRVMPHYSQPSSGLVSSMMEQLSHDAKFRRRLAETTTEDDDGMSNITSSYAPSRRSPTRQTVSPSRTCMTDSEILKSPTEVLYAVSDKYRHHNNERVAHSASQTSQSELQNKGYRHHSYDRRPVRGVRHAASKEDMRRAYETSRSLERFVDDDKENSYKARIQVVSPDRISPDRFNRKPYKTTINTATDNIQYKGSSRENLLHNSNNLYQKNQMYRRPDSEHYKVPRNKTPVEYHHRNTFRPMATDSDHSSVYYDAHNRPRGPVGPSRLAKNVDNRRINHAGSRELDREGRTIRRERNRHYSGASTSPDREEVSPDRGGYSRPKPAGRSYSHHTLVTSSVRSPSTSPTRPPRSRSSPGREIGASVIRRVTRTPSNRGHTNAVRSPVRENNVRRVHNDLRKSSYEEQENEERLARFTEYRGDGSNKAAVGRRGSSVYESPSPRTAEELARERGRSLPPGANIDSMRDFYKSSEYKSMYALPPSPNRPAPVLERAPSAATLTRVSRSQPRGPTRVSISEGEVNEEVRLQGRPRVGRNPVPPVRRASTKRQAPSPPGRRDDRSVVSSGIRRVGSSERNTGLIPPPARRIDRRKTSDGLDSSFSESEFNNEQDRRWPHSDMDSDYRRDLATNGGLHHEARSRDGGASVDAGFISTLRRNRSQDRRNPGDISDASPVTSAGREEERRKVLQIEEERIRREREVQLRRGVAQAQLDRSNSRIRTRVADDESAYSGHSSSSALRKDGSKLNRFDQHRVARVKRSTSNATNTTGPVRREINRKKLPASVTSSLNSSAESEPNQGGNRSVYLHAACVADIPPNAESKQRPPPPRALSAESREKQPPSNLQKSKKISRSISLLAPFKPKPTGRYPGEIHYDNKEAYVNKPPRPPRPSATNRVENGKKSASSSNLLAEDRDHVIVASEVSRPVVSAKVSRSVSMPKDTRLAGWFKKRKRV